MSSRAEVWSCGGGTQSIAIGALIIRGRLPRPDVAVIADTGREKGSTWDYCERVLAPWLASAGVTLYRVRLAEWGTRARRGVFNQRGTLLIPAYSNQSGSTAKLTNFCSGAWKREIVDRWLSREHGLTPSKVRKWLGFSIDEPRRWIPHVESEAIRLPLVRDVAMTREECRAVVAEMGWPEPPRSACYMCPNQADDEWLETRENRPEEFRAAVALERRIRQQDPHAFFHKQCVPLSQVDWTNAATASGSSCNSGECFV